MTRKLSLGGIVASTLLIAAAYGSAFLPGGAPRWAPAAMALGTSLIMVSCMALGAARSGGGLGRLRAPFAFVFLVMAGGFGYALLLPPPVPGEPLWLGLPRGAAVVLLGIGLLPLFVLPLAYALTFDEMTLGEDDLARVREQAKALAAGAPAGHAHAHGAASSPHASLPPQPVEAR